jgi:RND family efflux transporter MFP subunit
LLPLALALLAVACGRGGKAPATAGEEAQASLTVTTVQPESRSVNREIVASGSVAAWQEMSLGVELSGVRVSQVLVEVGARVRAGQPLLVLDRRTLDVQARQADANVAQARANLLVAESAKERGESLLANRLISTSNFEELTASLSRAQAQLTVAEADRDAARLRLSFATLRAPDDGVISSRTVQPGQIASTGTELLRLIRQGRLEWRAEVSYLDLPRIVPGAEVALSVPGAEAVVGRIRAVSPSVDPTRRTALVYADLPEPGALRAGMFAEGRLRVGQARMLAVPRESVVYRDGLPYVFLVGEDARVRQQRVEVGASQGDFVELLAGVDARQRVVGRGAGFLSDGDRVRIAAAAAAAAPPAGPAPAASAKAGS